MDALLFFLDTWPWNMASDSLFLVLYGVVVAAIAGIAWWQVRRMGDAIDAARQHHDPRLREGPRPEGADVWTVAYMVGGVAGLARTLLAAAIADGWLVKNGGAFAVTPTTPTDPALRALALSIRTFSLDAGIKKAALAVATGLTATIEGTLRDVGHRRSPAEARPLNVVIGIAVTTIVAVGGARLVARLLLSHLKADAPMELIMAVMMGGALVGTVLMPFAIRSSSWTSYVRWLTDSTEFLRRDVMAGAETARDDIVLAVAVGGQQVSDRIPGLRGFESLLHVADSAQRDS